MADSGRRPSRRPFLTSSATLATAGAVGVAAPVAADAGLACPAGGVQSYVREGRSTQFNATCVGTADYNGFYGAGIVNALGVVQ